MADLQFRSMADDIALLDIDFYTSTMASSYPPDFPDNKRQFRVQVRACIRNAQCLWASLFCELCRHNSVQATRSGVVHAIVCWFELFVDRQRHYVVSTNPSSTSRNRDMAWGQAIQSIEDSNFMQVDAYFSNSSFRIRTPWLILYWLLTSASGLRRLIANKARPQIYQRT